ncbi:unnamed protein product [Cladocopium goreaui]|uniref:Uncharacterized protein n=1 Tax=Cladocopium goreaui TaxID=2562237 RepID=A0A9P1BTR3_9DINO|nr:unnamed protein product [Cladocopium goreaui]
MARTFKWAKDAYESYEHSYGVMAMTDSLVDRLCNENKTLRGEVNEMKNQIAELQRGAESEAATFDPTVPVSEAPGELTRIHDTLRQELNSFLARENWEEAAEIQRCIMMVLDSLNIGQPLERGARIRLYQQLGDRLEHVADRQRVSNEALIAERFQRYANELRENAFAE